MSLEEKVKLINDLIKESEDYTIKDFIELLEEIKSIENGTIEQN